MFVKLPSGTWLNLERVCAVSLFAHGVTLMFGAPPNGTLVLGKSDAAFLLALLEKKCFKK